jgi:hypothetical protein
MMSAWLEVDWFSFVNLMQACSRSNKTKRAHLFNQNMTVRSRLRIAYSPNVGFLGFSWSENR